MWFDDADDVLRIALVGPAAYVALVVFLRLSGKRTLAKLNVFDFVVTVALGSTLATVLLNADVSFVEGVAGLGLLIVLQYVVATVSLRVAPVRRLVKSEPVLVVRDGEVLDDALHKERLNIEEVHQALRGSGVADIAAVAAVVLETDGSLSVVTDATPSATAMSNVRGWSAGDAPHTGGRR